MPSVPPHELGYTVGLIVGEGSFFVAIREDDRYEHGVDFGPKFSVTMGEFSQAMLEGQQALYGLGSVNKHPKGYSWTISSRAECVALVEFIDDYLKRYDAPEFALSPKFTSYQKWRATLDLLEPGKELSKEDIRKLVRFRDEINTITGGGRLPPEKIDTILKENDDGEGNENGR